MHKNKSKHLVFDRAGKYHLRKPISLSCPITISEIIPAPNATIGKLGPPKRPGLTPGSCSLTMPTSSWLRGGLVQYGVDGMTPLPMSSAFRGCLRYAIAAAMRSAWFVMPGEFAKSIMLSALSCWSQTPPVDRRALIPSMPARLTHGSFVKMSPPLAS
jgi:hypothetical protein